MNINIICIGKIKDYYIQEGIKEFAKRLNSYVNLKFYELKEYGNDSDRLSSMLKEEKLILTVLDKHKGIDILLDIQGKILSSKDMANYIEDKAVNGNNTLNFIIGGSYGVSDLIKNRANLNLSFSKMTFPHQLMRLILIEQIYRWFSIIKNTKYHK